MATYPTGIPSFPVLGSADYPQVSQFNTPNAEIVAICTELGVNPHVIDDSVAPGASPSSVAQYLDMLANIVKTMGGLGAWHRSAVPNRIWIGGHGNGGTVGASSTSYAILYGLGLSATENLTQHVVTFQNYNVVWDAFYLELLTSQPSSGGIAVTLRKGGVAQMEFIIPLSQASGIHVFAGDGELQGTTPASTADQLYGFTVNQFVSVSFFNTATLASAQIGAWAIEGRQVG